MYIGHFAIAYTLIRLFPGIPPLVSLTGVSFPDILLPIFILLGFEKAGINPDSPLQRYVKFTSYLYSYSLAVSFIISDIVGLVLAYSVSPIAGALFVNYLQMGKKMSGIKQTMLASVSVYIIWVIATYILEGRILTLLRPEALFERTVYTLVANFLIGTVVAIWVLRSSLVSGTVTLKQSGFRLIRRTLVAVTIAGVIGLGLFMILNPPSLNPVVILNVYAQVLTVSIAEIVVCWGVIGTSFEALTRTKGRAISMLVGILAADFTFGIYHFAHSPPFNQIGTILFLMIIGLFYSLAFLTFKYIMQ